MRRLVFIIGLFVTLAGCNTRNGQTADNEGSLDEDSARWRIAVMPTLDCLPLYVAADRGFFERAGVAVSLQPFQAQMDIDTALLNNRVAGAVTDLARLEHLSSQGFSAGCVTATDAHWQLVTKRSARITKLSQLDDKMLAMTRYSATDLLADYAVDSAKLKTERVFRIQVNDIGVRISMLQADIMDAMLLPEPQATIARNLKSRVLIDTRKLDYKLGALVFTKQSLKGKEAWLRSFLTAYDQAVDSLNEFGFKAYSDLIRQYMNVSAQTVDSLPADFRFSHAASPREKDSIRVKAWWNKRIESMKYVDSRYIQ
jgi:NitT/TauT family transport system substrate-binding protein